MNKKKVIWISVLSVAGALAAVYGIGCGYYSSHLMPHTVINGTAVGNDTAAKAMDALASSEGKVITLVEKDDKSETILLDDIDYQANVSTAAMKQVISSQSAWKWPAYVFKTSNETMDLDVSYDETKLEEALSALNCISGSNVVAPVNAHVERGTNGYEIVAETEGNTLDKDKTLTAVKTALSEGQSEVDLDAEGCYEEPTIKSDDEALTKELNLMKSIENEVITIDLSGATETLSGDALVDLLNINVDDATITVNDDKMTAYVDSLAEKYNTIYTQRTFTAHDGSTVTVGGGATDTYGWMMNKDSTKEAIAAAAVSGQSQTVSAFWDVTASGGRNGTNGDIGNTYIEVSISAQHLWYYKNGSLVLESDVITGKPEHGQDTPTGVFRIWKKEQNATLKGTAWDGSTWSSPVAYWMPITWTGVGLHDATWQSAFGGTLYYTRGSHGCINLSYSVAQSIFNAVDVNTPVVIY
ncbi:MAG: L,D-transpeptidase family protein [Lactimicrobium sp.]|jgi:hypothetical protein|uniref:L,D-transpeptidase family protein n=1 Tax=Lactimicrobium sp. TaxID=2563780 RepID=UPI002F3587C4